MKYNYSILHIGLLALCLGPFTFVCMTHAEKELYLEAAIVSPGYNDVAVPGDSGTRFSLTDDLDSEDTAAFRIRYGQMVSGKHWFGILAAPLTVDSEGTLAETVDFNGTTFAEGSRVDASFRFDSYRFIYRYQLKNTETMSFSLGGALKVRDAAIILESGEVRAEKKNTGLVPLISFNLTWMPHDKLHFLIDGEALAAPQGRAEDILFAARYNANDSLGMTAGYRILEGGADNDEVYTFSLFNYAVVGLELEF